MKNDLFKFFTTDNISGKKSTEKWLSKNDNEIYNEIINWCNHYDNLKNIGFKRKVFHYINNLKNIPKCVCGNIVKYKNLKMGYCKYCSDECSKNSDSYKQNWKKTWLENNKDKKFIFKGINTGIEKYGTLENYKKMINKNREKSLMKKYNVINVFQLNDVKNKSKKIKLEKYGDENWNNSDKTREIRIKNGTQINDSLIENFRKYKKIVVNRTNTVYRNNKKLINPNELKIGIKYYHLDHKYSIKQGFLNKIPIEIISHPCNLYVMWWQDNMKKQDKCDITLCDLIKDVLNYDNKNIMKSSILNELYQQENLEKIIKELKL